MSPMFAKYENVIALNLGVEEESPDLVIETNCPWEEHTENRVNISVDEFIQMTMFAKYENVIALNIGVEEESPDLLIETNCPWEEHTENRVNISVDEFIQMTMKNEIAFPKVESICLVKSVDADLMHRILNNCPKLCCLHINCARFTLLALNIVKDEIARKLIHLSTNGWIETIENKGKTQIANHLLELTRNCKNLQDYWLTIKPNDDFDARCLQHLSDTLIYLFIKDEKQLESDNDLPFPSFGEGTYSLEYYMQNLSKGSGRNLVFLRIEKYDKDFAAQPAFKYIAELSNLRGLNMSIRNEIDISRHSLECYKQLANALGNLITLTIRILPSEDMDNTNEILGIMSKGRFRDKLERFKLIDAELEWNVFERMMDSYKNLQSFQMIDCVLRRKDAKRIIKKITQMNLTELIIEINESADENMSDFKYLSMGDFIKLLNNCKRLKSFYLATHLTDKQMNQLEREATKRHIIFDFKNLTQ